MTELLEGRVLLSGGVLSTGTSASQILPWTGYAARPDARSVANSRASAAAASPGALASAGAPYGALSTDTSEYMLGSVTVSLVLLESDGSIDLDREQWTSGKINQVKTEVQEGLTWWQDTFARQGSNGQLSFDLDVTYADNPISTGYEPIDHPSSDEDLWIGSFLSTVGYNTGDYMSDVRQWDNAQRNTYGTDWAYTVFVVDSANDLDGMFTDGYFAYAYFGGPFMVMTYDNENWGIANMGQTFAHETGHIFYALDEYYVEGYGGNSYTSRSGYYATQNLNGELDRPTDAPPQVNSLMAEADLESAAYMLHTSSPTSLQMIGWLDSDGDGVYDMLDVPLSLGGAGSFDTVTSQYQFSGVSSVQTLMNRNPQSTSKSAITLNKVDQIQYRLDGGEWVDGNTYGTATAVVSQGVRVTSPGMHTIDFRTIAAQTGVTSDIWTDSFRVAMPNVAPTDISLVSGRVAENQPAGTPVGTLGTTDANEGDTFVYTLVSGDGSTDNDFFRIVGDQLRTTASLDYETTSSYTVRVRATDAGGLFTEKTFTLNVRNLNDAPTGLALSASSIVENQPAGTLIGTLSSTDPDGDNTFTYTLVSVNGVMGDSLFQVVNGQIKTTAALDYETRRSYTLQIRTTDAGGLSYEQAFSIAVGDANDAPTDLAVSSTRVLRLWPAGNLVGMLSSVDPDAGDTTGMTYALVAGDGSTHNSMFRIEGEQLKLNTMIPSSGVSSYSIRIRVTDRGGQKYEEVVAVRVAGTNVAPIDVTLLPAVVSEHQPAGTLVGTLRTADANEGDTFTYSLIRPTTYPDNASFRIVGDQLLTTSGFNYETKSRYSILVRVADAGGLSYSEAMTVNVANVNEAPSGLGLVGRTVLENKPAGTVVGVLGTTDGDIGNTFTYALVEGEGATDNAAFSILGNQLKTARRFGYEVKNAYTIRVRVTDQGGLSYEKAFTIRVTDVNEAPTAITLSNSSLAENNLAGALVGRLAAVDPDAASTTFTSAITYSLVPGIGSTDNAAFAIVGTRLNATGAFNYEAKSTYALRVRATDQGGLFCERAITVTVGNVNERPNDLRLTTPGATVPSVTRRMPAGTLAGTLSGRDPDAGSTLTYALISGTGSTDNAKFTIDGNQLLVGPSALTYTLSQTYKILVRVTDQYGLYYDKAFVLAVRAA
jgi:Cadherin domain